MIFIAYSWVDATFVHEFAKHLTRIGNEVWIDHERLNLQEDIAPQIQSAIKSSNLLLHFNSENSIHSSWVKFEKKSAMQQKKPIISLPISKSIYYNIILFDTIKKHGITGRCT